MIASEIILAVGRKVLTAMHVLRMNGLIREKEDEEAWLVPLGGSVDVEELSSLDRWASSPAADVGIPLSSTSFSKDRGGMVTSSIGGSIGLEGLGFALLLSGVGLLNQNRFFNRISDILKSYLRM